MARRKSLLITGFTATHVGSDRRAPQTKYVSAPNALRSVAETALNMEVENRPVIPGENLTRYDRVVVFVSALLQMNTMYAPGAFWTINQRPDAHAWIDDWQTHYIFAQMKVINRMPRYLWDATSCLSAANRAASQRDIKPGLKKIIDGTIDDIMTNGFDCVVAPMFRWGNPEKLDFNGRKIKRFKTWDPSGFVYEKEAWVEELVTPFAKRRRAWSMAALGDHARWLDEQNLAWSVDRFGHKSFAARKHMESDVIKHYATNTSGILSPNYRAARSGWWRARWNHAVLTQSLVGCSPDESPNLDLFVPPREIEAMSKRKLAELQKDQAWWLTSNTSSVNDVVDQLKLILR